MQEQPTPGLAASGFEIDGRGALAIRMWAQRRAEAGLPHTGTWDGPLVALAIALMWNKGVETETERFRHARGKVLDELQIAVDLRIGHDCVAEFIDRSESQRGSRAGGPSTAPGDGLTGDPLSARVGRYFDGSPVTSDLGSHRLPSPRAITA